jgi:magnesium transporter
MAGSHHRRRRRLHTKPGLAPGTIEVDPQAPKPKLRVIAYGPEGVEEAELAGVDEVSAYQERHRVMWLNVDGLGDADVIQAIGRHFDLHPLALEDVVSTHQRAKVDDYDDRLYIVARMLTSLGSAETEQLSLFLGDGFVVSFQERVGDCFEPVRERIRRGRTRIRTSGSDYLAYALVDAVVDAYFPVLEGFGDRLEALEDEVLSHPITNTLAKIHAEKRRLQGLRRAVWPLRDALSVLLRDTGALISEETLVFLRDCYDHVVRSVDLVETYRELASGLTDLYLSSVSNRMNEVMKVLTVVATIFIPLTFVAGIYGMNFDPEVSPWNMPELKWAWGYPACMALMTAIGLAMVAFFYRRGWLKGAGEVEPVAPEGPA